MEKYYVVEIVRDGDGNITDRILRYSTNKNRKSASFESEVILDASLPDIHTSKVSVDANGNLFIEESSIKKEARDFELNLDLTLKRMEFGKRLLAIMSIRNEAKGLSIAQKRMYRNDFSEIEYSIQNGFILEAKGFIDAFVPDGVRVTNDDRTKLLEEITINESDLGY